MPCGSCPYRCDVPSGIWAEEEYVKLEQYDEPTYAQPTGIFLCHQQDGRMCAGWVGVHGTQLLGLRLWASGQSDEVVQALLDYESSVPLFSSGSEAAEHGRRDIDAKSPAAERQVTKIMRKRGLL